MPASSSVCVSMPTPRSRPGLDQSSDSPTLRCGCGAGSRQTTRRPAWRRRTQAARPAIPAPTIATSCDMSGTANGFVLLQRGRRHLRFRQLMRHHLSLVRALHVCVALACITVPLHAQTIDDGLMMARRELLTGTVYTRDRWEDYWEGTLKRRNGNIGEITTQTSAWVANYGLTDRFNVMGAVPYMWTRASQGVLHGDRGLQDLTLAAKYKFMERTSPALGTLRAFAVASAGIPMTDYNNELLPLSLGTRSTQLSWRGTLNYQASDNWFVTGTTAYAWRSQTTLDREYFFADDSDEFIFSDTVDMPN